LGIFASNGEPGELYLYVTRKCAVDQLSVRDLPNVHGAHCIITPIDAKACLIPLP